MAKQYKEHHASVVVNAPVHQVYSMFTHFNDFPKFMSFVKEVTYRDRDNSHWVAEVAGKHEWDAVNSEWIPNKQIGWHSTNGLENFGKVTFESTGNNQTKVDVFIDYNPPAGVLGDIGEKMGVGKHFDDVLTDDLNHFARMVDQAPAGALDPTSSNYLFHTDSAAGKGTTTGRQNETMYDEPNAGKKNAPMIDRDITGSTNQDLSASHDADLGTVPVESDEVRSPVRPPEQNRDKQGY